MLESQTIFENELSPHFSTVSGQTALEWMAVISSLGGDYFTEYTEGSWIIFVPVEQYSFFDRQIAEYESERAIFEKNQESCSCHTKVEHDTSYSALHVSLILFFIHLISGPSGMNGPLINVGLLSIREVFNGEWWRPITALTLHGDIGHLLSNCMFLIVFIPHICYRLGATITWMLILASGIAGNITTCFFYDSPHRSLGASTSVFAALGILAGLAVIVKLRERQTKLAYKAFIAGVAMLAITGLNPDTDILAHIFGFFYGFIFAAVGYLLSDRISIKIKASIWMITCGLPVYAWYYAISKISL